MNLANLADLKSDTVRRWVETNPSPTPTDAATPKSLKNNNNNNTIDLISQTFWNRQKEEMPMLLQQPSHVLLSSHEADQPLDFTMSKFKTKNSSTTASQLKQFNNFAAQHMMLLQNNGLYFNRSNNNKSYTRASSPSSSSEEEGVGPPIGSPRSPPPSPGPLRSDGKSPSCVSYLTCVLLFRVSAPARLLCQKRDGIFT